MGDMSREPSMEEILSSIRRVIARDDPSQKGSPAAQLSPMRDEDVLVEEEEEDVLELTEAEPELHSDGEDESVAMSEATSSEPIAPATPELVSAVSAAASRQSLETLAAVLATGKEPFEAAPTAVSGDLSVNALAEAALRPMLKQWLDANLPQMVERLVAREIARITGSRL
jgi:uncharacterized protein